MQPHNIGTQSRMNRVALASGGCEPTEFWEFAASEGKRSRFPAAPF